MESGGIRGAGAAGRVRVSTRVGFARMLLDESWEGVRLIFAITGGCWARLAVDVIFGPMAFIKEFHQKRPQNPQQFPHL